MDVKVARFMAWLGSPSFTKSQRIAKLVVTVSLVIIPILIVAWIE